jgi:hypothetical protein
MRICSLRKYSVRLDPRKFKIAEKLETGEYASIRKLDIGVNASIPCQIKMTGEDGKPFYFAGQIHSISKKNLVGIAASSDEEAESGFIYDSLNENHLGDFFKKVDLNSQFDFFMNGIFRRIWQEKSQVVKLSTKK